MLGPLNKALSRRQLMRSTALLVGAGLLSACATRTREPIMRFIYPDQQGARIQDNPVPVRVDVRNFTLLTDSGYRFADPGARVVFFIDTPADAVADGQAIPDDPKKFVPANVPPFNAQRIKLDPGVHTITAVMMDGKGNKLP